MKEREQNESHPLGAIAIAGRQGATRALLDIRTTRNFFRSSRLTVTKLPVFCLWSA